MAVQTSDHRARWARRLLLAGGLLLLASLISIGLSDPPSNDTIQSNSYQQARQYLAHSLEQLQQQEGYLRYQSYQLSDDLMEQFDDGARDRLSLYRTINRYTPELQRAVLFEGSTPWAWAGDVLTRPDVSLPTTGPDTTSLFIDPASRDLTFFTSLDAYSTDSTRYHLLTFDHLPKQFRLITGFYQTDSSPGFQNPEVEFPINLAINYVPPRDSLLVSAPLKLQDQDSIGVAYITASFLSEIRAPVPHWQRWLNLSLLGFALLLLFIAGWTWSSRKDEWIQLVIRFSLWIVSGTLCLMYLNRWDAITWLPSFQLNTSELRLLQYTLLGLWSAATGTTIISVLYYKRRLYGFTWYPRTILVSFLFGSLSALLLLGSAFYTLDTVERLGQSILYLSILPDAENFVFQISAGFLWGALLALITTLSWFLFNSEEDQLRWVPPFTIAGFISALLLYLISRPEISNATLLLAGIAVIAMGLCSWIGYSFHKNSLRWRFISRARFYALAIFFVALGTYTLFGYGVRSQLRKALSTSAEQAAALPIGAEQAVAGILSESLDQQLRERRVAYGATVYPLEAQLRHELTKQTKRLEDRYVIQAYILNRNSRLRASASTGLSSLTLTELREVIATSQNTESGGSRNGNRHFGWSVRDISQGTLIVNVETRHSEREQPLYFPNMQGEDLALAQSPVQMLAYYQNGNLVSVESRGSTHTFPIQQELPMDYSDPQWEEYPTDHGTFLAFIYPLASVNQTIMAISRTPSWQQHLYLLFRYYFVLLIGGLLLLQILSWLGILEASIYRKNERFRNRIIDSYLIASLSFLVILTVATHVIMQQQQRSQVEQRLMETLDQLSETLPQNIESITDQQLLRFSTPFQTDALLYRRAEIQNSTYPELISEGWFASFLPFDIYHQLFDLQQKRAVSLQSNPRLTSHLSLLYSFQRLNQNSDWVLAVPTILDRSRIDQQMLQTISYLLVIYVFIFGLFMLSAAMIARELTRPLLYFQSGLKRISSGKLDTTIPVTTQDEIGSLAHAYNVMVYKLKDLRKELAEAERQAAWTEMARQVAHEIKNPLTPMKLQLQHLKRIITSGNYDIEELKPKATEITSTLVEQIQSLSTIASDFSRFAKPFESELEEVDLNKMLHDIDQLYQHDERIHIEPDLSQDALPIMAAQDELKRVFINLVKNASEAMPHGGVIYLRSYQHKEHAYVDVIDNGQGITEDHKAKIFVPNFSTKTSGTGLGLAISKKIVEAHRGEIDFASVPGSGTTFTIALPLNGFHSS
jgi:signal transduction histidine kinase